MNETASIDFVLHGKVEGLEITPRTIGLSQFNEFNLQVEAFIGGSQKVKLDRFAAKGAEAWADVPDAAQWVRNLRRG